MMPDAGVGEASLVERWLAGAVARRTVEIWFPYFPNGLRHRQCWGGWCG